MKFLFDIIPEQRDFFLLFTLQPRLQTLSHIGPGGIAAPAQEHSLHQFCACQGDLSDIQPRKQCNGILRLIYLIPNYFDLFIEVFIDISES